MADSDDGDAIDSVLVAIAKAPPRAPPLVLAGGDKLGDARYTIRRLLGRGGMGSVYEAYDEVLAKPVALKILRATGGTDALARIRAEVQLAHEVTHPNVCRTFDLEQVDSHWIVKMELVAGSTLADHAAGKRLAIREVVAIARQIAAGLHAAHERGIVHRDLKPQNILIEAATGRVVISDFGLAHRDEGPADDTAGTPAYMAPEQARGDAVDARADLYAFGCVIYLLLTGDAVFAADTPTEIVHAHAVAQIPDARVARPETPAWLAQLVKRLLAKDPEQRPSDAELARALAPRRPRIVVVVAALGVALVTLGVVAVIPHRPMASWRPDTRDIDPEIEEYAGTPTWSPDGASLAFASNRGGSMRVYVEPIGGTARPIGPRDLHVWVPHWTRDGRAMLVENNDATNVETAYRIPIDDSAPAQPLGAINWPEDCGGGRLVFVRLDPNNPLLSLLVVREFDGRERELTRATALIADVRCDRAGERIVYTLATGIFSGSLWIESVAGGAPRLVVPNGMFGSFDPDGTSVVASLRLDDHMNIWKIPLVGGRQRQVTFGAGPDLSPQVSPDGRQLAYTTGNAAWTDTRIYAYTVPGGAPRKLTRRVETILHIAVSPDGAELAIHVQDHEAGDRDRIAIVSTANGDERVIADGAQPTITRDGREVVYISGSSIYAIPIAGGVSRLVTTIGATIKRIAIDPDDVVHADAEDGNARVTWTVPLRGGPAAREASGSWLIPSPVGSWRLAVRSNGATSDIYVLAPGMQAADPRARVVRDVAAESVSWAPDGAAIIYADTKSTFRKLDVVTGESHPIVSIDTSEWWRAQLAPDGKTVYVVQGAARSAMHVIANYGELPP